MHTLSALDLNLFLAINHLYHSFLLDWLALFFSGVGSAGFVWLGLGFLLFLKEEKKDYRFFLPMVISVGTCWVLVEAILKYLFGRQRPNADMGAIIVGDGASWFSFPSGHAAISWAMAIVLSHYEPKLRYVWYTLAGIISISRIYLGVHYPTDVIAGAFIGILIGKGSLYFLKRKKHVKISSSRRRKR